MEKTKKTSQKAPATPKYVKGNTAQVVINGQPVDLKYSFATEVSFRKISGKGIEHLDPEDPSDLVALLVSCEMAAYTPKGEDIPADSETILNDASSQELLTAFEACFFIRRAWYKCPKKLPKRPRKERPQKTDYHLRDLLHTRR